MCACVCAIDAMSGDFAAAIHNEVIKFRGLRVSAVGQQQQVKTTRIAPIFIHNWMLNIW